MAASRERPAHRRARWQVASPIEVALRLLEARFGPPPADPPAGDGVARPVFELADFQRDAVRRASRILAARRGVVVADSVGLGKTYVALTLAEQELRRGGRVLVVAPAALRRDWVPALRRLADGLGVARTSGLGAWRRGAGSLLTDGPIGECTDADPITGSPAALPHDPGERERAGRTGSVAPALPGREARAATRAGPPFLAWVSHARLSRGAHGPERLYPLDLVVVDEAHAFRSPGTRRYRALAALCRGARVVLLTATPVNNSVSDL